MRTTEPTTVTQGEQAEWKRSFCGFPATEWTLEYRFRGPGPGADVAGVADGTAFITTLLASQSLPFAVGRYRWQAWVTEIADPTNEEMIAEGSLTIEQGFVSGDTGDIDLRSNAKKMLDAIDAALLVFATSDIVEYEITTPAGNRRVKRSDKTALISERKYWAGIVTNEIAREGAKNGKPLMNNIYMKVYDA
jgi:hypothetical protein